MRQVQEAESLLYPSSTDATSPTTTSQAKRKLSASTDADAEDAEREDGMSMLSVAAPNPYIFASSHLSQKSSLASHVAAKK